MKIRKWFEIALIKLARNILINRNVARSAVVSRRDNNDMWYMSEKLDGICKRMQNEYQDT
jgi:hypothetical protein